MFEVSLQKNKKHRQTNMEPNPKQLAVERIKEATNILVTVSKNPTVDQLSACIGFTLLLNKLGKHATAVFSGEVPSTIQFLQPQKTLEQNTDSLRDFIIALDKSKADKLRYKVEDEVVRIFITPYRTSISDKDLEFSQGDFNVDVVVALGVTNKDDIDTAIVAHGRILHDAIIIGVSAGEVTSEIGGINWNDASASSLSEMLVSVSESFQSGLLDSQMSTAFLTGIVSETERFSNNKTSPKVMTMSAQLMAAGANQQLIAEKLKPVEVVPEPILPTDSDAQLNQPGELETPAVIADTPKPDGEIEISHDDGAQDLEENDIHIDDQGNLKLQEEIRLAAEAEALKNKELQQKLDSEANNPPEPTTDNSYISGDGHKVIEPINQEKYDPLAAFAPAASVPQPSEPVAQAELVQSPVVEPVVQPELIMPSPEPALPPLPEYTLPELSSAGATEASDTLAQLEEDVHSPHVGAAEGALETPNIVADVPMTPEIIVPDMPNPASPAVALPQPMAAVADVLQQSNIITPTQVVAPVDPMSPPPVPPPMMPQYFSPTANNHSYMNPSGPTPQIDSNPQQL